MKRIKFLRNWLKAVYIFTGGYTGEKIIKLFAQYGLKIKNIIDDDEGLQGRQVQGIGVISYEQFCKDNIIMDNVSIVLTSIYAKTILKKIGDHTGLKIYELFDWYNEIGGNGERVNRIYQKNELLLLKQKLNELRAELSDRQSVDTMEGIVKYFETRDLNVFTEICTDEEQYFIPEVLQAVRKPLYIIDGGAFRGELLYPMMSNKLNIGKWYCFEPDKKNYALLIEQSKHNNMKNKQICVNKGLWSENGRVYFEGGNSTGSRIVDYKTDEFVDVASIDEFIGNSKCNFIKMDIEGSELPALRGAMNVIKRERPILTICIYHSLRDFWEIPEYLMNELDNYKFYVRHHSVISCETVLYAIPN